MAIPPLVFDWNGRWRLWAMGANRRDHYLAILEGPMRDDKIFVTMLYDKKGVLQYQSVKDLRGIPGGREKARNFLVGHTILARGKGSWGQDTSVQALLAMHARALDPAPPIDEAGFVFKYFPFEENGVEGYKLSVTRPDDGFRGSIEFLFVDGRIQYRESYGYLGSHEFQAWLRTNGAGEYVAPKKPHPALGKVMYANLMNPEAHAHYVAGGFTGERWFHGFNADVFFALNEKEARKGATERGNMVFKIEVIHVTE